MLIVTERHRPEDLDKWAEYEQTDEINAKAPRLQLRIGQAVDDLDAFAHGRGYIGVSWGKDSVVVADLAMRNGINLPLVHLRCIPSHNAYCDLVRDEFLRIWPGAQYHEIACDYGDIYRGRLAAHEQDKATDKIWFATLDAVGGMFGDRHVSGVRGAESNVRNLRMARWGVSTPRTCAPIGYWPTPDVFAYLHAYDLPIHPNYGMLGGGRWDRHRIRTAEIGDIHGNGCGRTEWEREYYGDWLNRLHAPARPA